MANCCFNIRINAGPDKGSSRVSIEGRAQHVITKKERETFGLDGNKLNHAVAKYHNVGTIPTYAYLHDPTQLSNSPICDIYKKQNWQEVKTTVVATSARIVEITSQPVILNKQDFTNNCSAVDVNYNAGISDSVTETSGSTWDTRGLSAMEQKINYQIGFLGTGGGGETNFSYKTSWGEGGTESKQVSVGSSSGINVTLKPGQSVSAELTAYRGVMKIQIEYEAYLTGGVVVNYAKAFKGSHTWSLPIDAVMYKAEIPNSIVATEAIEVGYFSNAHIKVSDRVSEDDVDGVFTGHEIEPIKVIPVDIGAGHNIRAMEDNENASESDHIANGFCTDTEIKAADRENHN